MKQITAATFKAHCLAAIKKVQTTGEPLLVTLRGRPLVKIVSAQAKNKDLFGWMAGKGKIVGDIESSTWSTRLD